MRPSDTTHGEPYKRIIGVIIGGERFSLSSLSAYRISDQSSGLRTRAGSAPVRPCSVLAHAALSSNTCERPNVSRKVEV
jgi:hypothetical protein